MLTKTELLNQAISLPVDERADLINSLMKSLNIQDKTIDKIWIKEAKKRLHDLKSGEIKAVPGELVFQRVQERFKK